MAAQTVRNKLANLRVNDHELEQIQLAAAERGQSVSGLLRYSLQLIGALPTKEEEEAWR